MGRDCQIVAFPPGRCYRRMWLDRLWVFDRLAKEIGAGYFAMFDIIPPVTARVMTDAIRKVMITSDVRHERADYIRHWHGEAFRFVERVSKRWGESVPVMIYDEEWEKPEHPALGRLARIKALPEKREIENQRQHGEDFIARFRSGGRLREL